MSKFKLVSNHAPSGDQPKAIEQLTERINNGERSSVLLGATGTGKTFTIANVISKVQKKTLVLAHNKTLAAQLYAELKQLFPENRVEYFVSYFDFYQPEAYVPRSDTYIEKSSSANDDIKMLRLSTLNSLVNHEDVIVVGSVATIYGAANPKDFSKYQMVLKVGDKLSVADAAKRLVKINYEFAPIELKPGTYRSKGDVMEIAPGTTDQFVYRISYFGNEIEEIASIEPLTGKVIDKHQIVVLPSANEYVVESNDMKVSLKRIEDELSTTIADFRARGKLIEAQRIEERTVRDLEEMKEFGFCSGIENYSCHLELRNPGEAPYTLFDYFGDDWLLVMDESHISVPQIRGMSNTDLSRKKTLVEYGFRLPSAIDNRPLNFNEWLAKMHQVIYVSATPNEWEIEQAGNTVVEQIVRPTGLVDPQVEIRPSLDQINDIMSELKKAKEKNQRAFLITLTIRMAEDLSEYLKQKGLKVTYLHNKLGTMERSKVLADLRRGRYDAVIGINLLREGLDIPEVALIAIFDADKEGFLRNTKSLIQIIGRAARNLEGRVIMYADNTTESMKSAINETNRRRNIQILHNQKHNITPKQIIKDIRDDIKSNKLDGEIEDYLSSKSKHSDLTKRKFIGKLRQQMQEAAKNQDYEKAAELRDMILELEANNAKQLNSEDEQV